MEKGSWAPNARYLRAGFGGVSFIGVQLHPRPRRSTGGSIPADVRLSARTCRSHGRGSLEHVLPSGYTKIRHFGLHASGNLNTKLAQARLLLSSPSPLSSAARQQFEEQSKRSYDCSACADICHVTGYLTEAGRQIVGADRAVAFGMEHKALPLSPVAELQPQTITPASRPACPRSASVLSS